MFFDRFSIIFVVIPNFVRLTGKKHSEKKDENNGNRICANGPGT